MKKRYSKPELIYESFSLAGATIASCSVDPNAGQVGQCTVNLDPNVDTGWYIFNTNGVCNFPSEQFCPYDISGENYNVFTS